MADRPILFSGAMVRAILDGRKFQTRRVLRPQPGHPSRTELRKVERGYAWYRDTLGCPDYEIRLPYQPGDRLWVRETWKPHSIYNTAAPRHIPQSKIFYRADDTYSPSNTRWRPGIHMPRWASRLTLYVTDARVQRVQEISEEDARAEGHPYDSQGRPYDPPETDTWQGYATYSFTLDWWQHRDRSAWDRNDWVVAVTFEPRLGNIDNLPLELAA